MKFFNPRSKSYSYYIALGDSISTDDYPGEGKGAASLLFKALKEAYAEVKFHPLALDGATTSDVLHHQLHALPRNTKDPVLVTLTAGGNDILTDLSSPSEIISRIDTIVRIVFDHFPQSRVLLGTIYDPTDGVGDLLDPDQRMERELKMLRETNAGIRHICARYEYVRLVEIYQHFLGHGSHYKDRENPYYHPDDASSWFMMGIEPNQRGAQEVFHLFLDNL